MRNRVAFTICGIVLLDVVGFGMVLPLMPYIGEVYGASDLQIGLLIASYGLAQFLAAPWLGNLSDRWGRKPILALSLLGSATGFLLWGYVTDITSILQPYTSLSVPSLAMGLLFVGRTLDGLSGGNLPLAQAVITDVTDHSSRGKGLAFISACLGMGFIIGPPLGGWLSEGGHYEYPCRLAALFALINCLAVLAFLKETRCDSNRAERKRTLQGLSKLRPSLQHILVASIGYFYVYSIFTGTFTLYTLNQLEMSSKETGNLLGVLAAIAASCQIFFVGKLIRRYGEPSLLRIGLPSVAVCLLAWGLVQRRWEFYIVILGMAVLASVLNVSLRSRLTKLTDPNETGRLLGYQTSIESAARVLGPLTGAALMEWGTPEMPGLVAGSLLLLSLPLLARSWRSTTKD